MTQQHDFRATMRKLITVVAILATASPGWAAPEGDETQSAQVQMAHQRRVGMMKILSGAGLAGFGALLVAASHESASGEFFGERFEVSATNTGGMIAGLGMLGGGGFLIYSGAKDRKDAAKASPSIGISVGRRRGVYVTKRW